MRAALTALALLLVVTAMPARAEDFYVVEIARNDALKVREYPNTSSRVVGMIPPDTHGVHYKGESRGSWFRVQYGQVEGWVPGTFVAPDIPIK